MTQQTLQLAFSVQGRQTAVGQKVAKQPVMFKAFCTRCGGNGIVERNEDYVLWFDCPDCQYSASWKQVAAEKRVLKLAQPGIQNPY